MPLELAAFSDKLKRYRSQFNATIETVSAATGIPVASLTELEAATRAPTGDEVLILSDYFKCDYRFLISNEQKSPIEQTEKLFRRFGKELSAKDRWAIQEFLFLCECESFLQQELRGPTPAPFRPTTSGTYFKKHGEDAAAQLRKHLGYGPAEIPSDVFHDFRRMGVHVFRRALDNSGISGLFIQHPAAGPCVLVNYSEDVFRQRFTASHEVGHALFDYREDFVVSFEWSKEDLVEIRATTFAAHFLLPDECLSQLTATAWDADTIIDWSRRLMVNVDTLLIGLQRAGRLGSGDAARLKGLRVPRNLKPDPEIPPSLSEAQKSRKLSLLRMGLSNFFVTLCFDALNAGVISAARAAEMMLVEESELRDLNGLYGGVPIHGA